MRRVGDYKQLIIDVLDCPDAVNERDHEFINDLADFDHGIILSQNQIDWLDKIQEKMDDFNDE